MTDESALRLLALVSQAAGGECGRGVDLWAVAETGGFERGQAQDLAMELSDMGLLVLASLSGKIELTPAGEAQTAGAGQGRETASLAAFIELAGAALADLQLAASARRDLTCDLETLALQSRRSRPLSGVIQAVLEAALEALEHAKAPESLLEAGRACVG